MSSSCLSVRSVAATLALAGTIAFAQTAQVQSLPGACGSPLPVLNATLPVVTQPFTIFVTSSFPNAPILMLVTPPQSPVYLANGCVTEHGGAYTVDSISSSSSSAGGRHGWEAAALALINKLNGSLKNCGSSVFGAKYLYSKVPLL